MSSMSFETLRVGKRYRIVNYGDVYEFEIQSRLSDSNFILKDLHTLETFELDDVVRWGRSGDFTMEDLN